MERYKVILVDDEAEVIDMIEKKIHWNDLGFEVAGSATNGVKALELVEKLQPDVVLTDCEAALEALFPVIYESAGGQNRIFEVPEEYRQ